MDEKSNNIIEEKILFYLNSNKLGFSPGLELSFLDDYYQKTIVILRIALGLGIGLYSLFGALDFLIAPKSWQSIWFIRFGIVCPILIGAFVFSFFKFFKHVCDIFISFVSLVAGAGIVLMMVFLVEKEAANFYYAGLMLVIMWIYTFTRLRFFYATIVSWAITVAFEFVSIGVLNLPDTPQGMNIFLNNNFFFIASNVMGMIICYLFELSFRKDYLQRLLISEKQALLAKERNELYRANKIIKQELEMARTIQQNLIPQTTPSAQIYSIYKPMEELGGDLYDFIEFENEDKIGIFLSDVSGHGVPSALITSMVKSVILESKDITENPSRLLSHLNRILIGQTHNYFITVFYGIFDFKDRSFCFANAGHNPPYICHHDKVVPLEQDIRHCPIAVVDNEVMHENDTFYKNYNVVLPEKCKLVLYTDGLVESLQAGSDTAVFEDVLEEEILKLMHLNAREFVNTVYKELVRFHGSEQFDDDISIICMDIE